MLGIALMQLDSVRSLKQDIVSTVLPKLVERLPTAHSYGLPAAPIPKVEENPRALALGISPEGNGFKLAVRIQHRGLLQSNQLHQIERRAKGETDVRYIGRVHIRAASLRARQRPLIIGCSVGHQKITAGTLGAFVRPKAAGPLAMLSNNHVLANENRAKPGDATLQPGTYDGGKVSADEVAKLTRFVRLRRTGANTVDAAFATLDDGIDADVTKLRGIGKLKGVRSGTVVDEIEVAKVGRTTGATHGRVTAFEVDDVVVDYDLGSLRFNNQLEIESDDAPFSSGGDSGSLIVDSDRFAVGLLFAGSDQGGVHGHGTTYANPIQAVLDALDVRLVVQW
jgi:hypothetical protein